LIPHHPEPQGQNEMNATTIRSIEDATKTAAIMMANEDGGGWTYKAIEIGQGKAYIEIRDEEGFEVGRV